MEYFLSKSYLKHINKKNPLGMGGQLADAYGSLMQELWNERFSYTAPRTLKVILGPCRTYVQQTRVGVFVLVVFLLSGCKECRLTHGVSHASVGFSAAVCMQVYGSLKPA